MTAHKTPESLELISALLELGPVLGYVGDDEVPVTISGGAVDVAWFRSATDRVPLFIFEIESQATSSAASNPLKVFAQKSTVLPKPLFYFHIFMNENPHSERIGLLEQHYGTYNYRTYREVTHDRTTLVCDILEQHRRVASELNLFRLVSALRTSAWEQLDLDRVLELIEDQGFRSCYVPDYARLSYVPKFRPHLIRQLLEHTQYGSPRSADECWYTTWIGETSAPFLHAGIVAAEVPEQRRAMLDRLREWQEHGHMKQLGPYLGLSQDYDRFILGSAAPLLALTGALFPDATARRYCSGELRHLVAGFGGVDPDVSLFSAVWLLWLAAAAESADDYEFARGFIADRGGANPALVAQPPSIITVERESPDDVDAQWWELVDEDRAVPPPFKKFLTSTFDAVKTSEGIDVVALGLDALLSDETLYTWSMGIRRALGQRMAHVAPVT